jgi:hypothetical protein
VSFIPFHFCSVLFVINEGKGMMLFCCCFVEVRILIFCVLFLSFFFSCLYRDRPFFCAGCKFVCVCVCVLFPFRFCSVMFVIKEGKGMMLFCCCFVEVRILIFYVLFLSFFFSCLYRDWPFFCAGSKFFCVCVCVFYFHFIFVRSCLC